MLFYGVPGIGKRTTAIVFAMASNCQEWMSGTRRALTPCGFCRSCRKIISGNHPDVIHIKPSNAVIRIVQIRELLQTLSLKPYESKTRVAIISDAHAMNPEASNALLKMLEEPPDQTVLILTTEQRFDLLPTVVSRCQQIRFKPLSKATLKNLLVEKQDMVPENADILAALANGSFTKAVEMSQGNWLHKRSWIIGEMASLESKSIGLLLAFAESLSKNKEVLLDTLDVMSVWLRDVLVYKWSPQNIVNEDMIGKIQNASRKCSEASLLSQITLIQNVRKDIRANANVRLTLDSMVVRLAKVKDA